MLNTFNTRISSSPRTRRYFRKLAISPSTAALFSAHAEVFHMSTHKVEARADSSPRTRRYFRRKCSPFHPALLFSAHAEVFLGRRLCCGLRLALLRARGGISEIERLAALEAGSSPRTRRYFPLLNNI